MSKVKRVRDFIKNGVITVVQSTCSFNHLALRYGIDIVESIEVTVMKRMTGQLPKATLDDRRRNSNVVRLENKRMYNTIRDDFRKLVAKRFGTAEDVIIESSLHGDA